MVVSGVEANSIPSDLKVLIIINMGFAVIGLVLGVPLILFNFNLPPLDNLEFETLKYFRLSLRYVSRSLGIIGTVLGGYALISSILTLKRSIIGWLMLVALYLAGLTGCIYLLFRFNELLSNYPLLSLPWPPIIGSLYGILGIVVLIRIKNIKFIFKRASGDS